MREFIEVGEDVRDESRVMLLMDDLVWHSGGVFSNVYRFVSANRSGSEPATSDEVRAL